MVANRKDQVDLGAYYTPERTAAYIVEALGHDRVRTAERIVEPAGGDGVFVGALLDAQARPGAIEVWDIDPDTEAAIDALGVDFSLGDALERSIPEASIDLVVGNPPYLNKRSAYIRENRHWLAGRFREIGASETYVMFTYHLARALREGGRLGFLLSDTFLSLGTHRRLRDWLLEHTKIIEVALAPLDLFPAAVSTVILVVERCEDAAARDAHLVRFYDRPTSELGYGDASGLRLVRQSDLCRLPNHALVPVDDEVLRLFADHESLSKAGLRGHIGMHTRDNARYVVAAAADAAGLAAQAAQVRAGKLMPYLKTGGIADYWAPVREFLRWDAASQAAYVIPRHHSFGESGVAISGISSRLSARILEPGCYWDTNKVMGFRNQTDLSDEALVGLLNSQLYNYLAKGVLNTTSSIQIEDLRSLPLIELTSEQAARIERLVREIIRAKRTGSSDGVAAARDAIDQVVFEAAGASEPLRAKARAFWRSEGRG